MRLRALTGGQDVLPLVIRKLLRDRIGDLNNAELDIMARVAFVDYINYVKTMRGLLDYPDADDVARFLIEEELENNTVKALKELSEWLDVWIWKWRQRVKLVMSTKEMPEQGGIERDLSQLYYSVPITRELKTLVLGSLIRSGEVCFTDLLAENIVKASLAVILKNYGRERAPEAVEKNSLVLLDDALRRVKKLKRHRGHLVMVKVESRLFRDENVSVAFRW